MVTGIHLHFARDVETLASELAGVVARPLSSPFARDALIVGCAGMDRWVVQQLARARGVWVPAWTTTPRGFVSKLIALVDGPEAAAAASTDTAAWLIARSIRERLSEPELAPVRRYLADDPDQSKRIALARRVAELYERYALHRPDLLRTPATGELAWQSIVLADLDAHLGPRALDRRLTELAARVAQAPGVPERISVFGASSIPTRVLDLIEAVAACAEVHVFVPRVSEALSHERRPRHPLLVSLAQQARAGLTQLSARAADITVATSNRALGTSALAHLQRELADDAPAARVRLADDDRSIEVFSCHGPMREAETVRDRLLAMFAADASLRPRDVAILTPDLDTYAPYLEAAFTSGDAEKLPFRIADGGGRRRTTGGRALIAGLEVLRGRFEASAVLGLCAHPTVRARYALEESDVDTIASWIHDLAVHWGTDATHREALGHVDDLHKRPLGVENTWRVALDRLLLGVAVPGHDERIVHGVLPYDDVEGDRAELAGRVAELIDGLMAMRSEVVGERRPSEWRAMIERLIDHLLPSSGQLAFERTSLLRRMSALWDGATAAENDAPIALTALLPWIESLAEDEAVGVGFAAGSITAAALLPMRQVPFRVIALVGLADGVFPRRTRVDPIDRALAEPRSTDPSPRDEDRGAFLDALLAARDRLILTYPGHDAQENTERPPSVVVSELIDVLEATFEHPHERFVTHVPLAPWDPKLFRAGPVQTTSVIFAEGARAMLHPATPEPPFVEALLPDQQVDVVDLGAFARRLGSPIKSLLKERLQLDLGDRALEVDDLDPHKLDGLGEWKVRDRVFRAYEKNGRANETDLRRALRASGHLPPGGAGEMALDEAFAEADDLFGTAESTRGGERLPPRSIDLPVGGVRLVGTIDSLYPNGRVIVRTGSMRLEHQIDLWVSHLAMLVAGAAKRFVSTIVYCAKKGNYRVARTWTLGAPKVPMKLLADLVDLYRIARVTPLLAFDGGSQAAARALIDADDEGVDDDERAERAREAMRKALDGKWQMNDAPNARALRGAPPWEPGFRLPAAAANVPDAIGVADRLVVPMLRAEAE